MALFLIHGRAVTATGVKSISFAMGCQIRQGFRDSCGRKITGTRRKTAFWGLKKYSIKVPTIEPPSGRHDFISYHSGKGRIPIFPVGDSTL